ncbi:MAG: penicillin-binding protein [Lishizhenia sp.]
METKKNIILKTYMIYILFVLIMITVIVKSIMIRFDGRENVFSTNSDKIEYRTAEITPRRGEILDCNLSPLVTSVSFFDLYMDTKTVKKELWVSQINGLCKGLSELFPERSAREWYEYLNRRRNQSKGARYVLIQKGVTNDIRQKVRKLPIYNEGQYKGGLIDREETIVRKRPHEMLMQRTLGYVKAPKKNQNKDTLLVGIEGAFNNYLKGEVGQIVQQKISGGWKSTGSVIKESLEGADVVTTIDKNIQEVAHSELLHQLKEKGGRYGVAIVMEVKTGFVKAMVNLSADKDGNYYESYNHAIGTKQVPGSTFKLASLMAALEDGKVNITDSVKAVGKYEFYDRSLNDDNKYGYGTITLKRAFEKSSNVIGKVIFDAYRKEPQDFISRLNSFGLTEKLGINILGEKQPYLALPGTKDWWGGSLAWMSIGYEVQQTPLQTLAFYNSVANNGTFVKPQFASEIRRGTQVIKKYDPIVINEKVCSDKTLKILQDCLEGVVEHGTGKQLKSSYFKIAGKTGTAKIAQGNQGYGIDGEQKYIASFVGYFPADDPVYSCIVVVSDPTKDIYGASVSGTVFTAIANKVFATSLQYQKAVNEGKSYKSIPYSKDGNRFNTQEVLQTLKINNYSKHNAEWINTNRKENGIILTPVKVEKNKVPDVKGMGLRDALVLLEKTGMKVRAKGYGAVSSQSLAPGSTAVAGGIIEIELR